MTLHQLDLVLADCQIPAAVSTRVKSHKLRVCIFWFLVRAELAQKPEGNLAG